MKIDRKEIVAGALALLQEVGLDKLSTRALAARLGVQQPALYWHFNSKRDLMDAMNAEIMRTLRHGRPLPEAEGWTRFVLEDFRAFRRALLAYRDGARIHAGSRAETSDLDAAEAQLARLVAAGVEAQSALRLLITLSRFTVGFVLEEQAEMDHPPFARHEDLEARPLLAAAFAAYATTSQDQLFDEGLAAIIAGAGIG